MNAKSLMADGPDYGDQLEALRPRLERLVAVRMDPRLRRRIDPADVIQAAFVDVLRRLDEWLAIRARMPFFLWVRLMTVQKLAEFHRRNLGARMRDVRREVDGIGEGSSSGLLAQGIVDQHESPSKEMSRIEQEEVLRHLLDQMKPIDREILILHHFERLTLAECARVLGLTHSGAKLRHLRAARRLRILLRRTDSPPDLFDGEKKE